MSDIERLQRGIVEANRRGDEAAVRALGVELRRIQSASQEPQRAPGSIQQQAGRGIANAAANIGSGMLDLGATAADRMFLRPLDMVTGGWEAPERAREQLQGARGNLREANAARNEQFNADATGVERGAKLATDVAAFFVPGTQADKAVRGLGTLSRVAGQGATAMGLDAVMQRGEGAEELDGGRLATTGALAGGAEILAPALARLGRAGVRAVRSALGRQADDPIALGREIARRAGVEEIPDDLARRVGQAADEVEAGARPEAVLAEKEFGFRLTRGQKTGDYGDLSAEDLLRQTNQGRQLRNIDEANAARQGQLVDEMTGGLDSPQTVVDNARRSVRGARDAAEEAERAAWRQLDNSQLRLSSQVADDFAARTAAALKQFPTRESKVAADAYDALKQVDDILRQGDSIDMRALQDARSTLSSRAANAATPREAAMLNRAKKAFDDALSAVDDSARVGGDLADIGKLRDAIGQTASKYRTFTARGKGDDAGRAVETILQTENVDKLTSRLLGSGQVTGLSTGDFARALTRTLGREAPELQQLRQAVLLKAATRSGDAVGPQQLSRNLKKLLKERKDVLGQLFSPEEVAQLGRMTQALDVLWQKPGTIGRSSGTTERAIRFMESMGGEGGLPVLRQVGQLGAWIGRRSAARRAVTPLRTTPTLPAVPAAAAGSNPNRSSGP